AVRERAARDPVVVAREIAEDLQRQAERFGEKRGDRVVRAVCAGEDPSDLAPLVVRVRPVLDPTASAKEGIDEARDVAGGINVWDCGPKPVVDGDPVVDLDTAARKERELGSHADADDGKAWAEDAARVQLDRVESRPAAERPHLVAPKDVDAALTVEGDQVLRDLRRSHLREQIGVTAQEAHVEAEIRQRRGDLHADEAAADDDGITSLRRRVANRSRVVERAEGEDAREACALDVERSRRGAGGDEELAVA